MSTSPDGVVRCYQCGWPLLRGQGYVILEGFCPHCQTVHLIGIVHEDVCAASLAAGLDRATTQKHRLVILRMN